MPAFRARQTKQALQMPFKKLTGSIVNKKFRLHFRGGNWSIFRPGPARGGSRPGPAREIIRTINDINDDWHLS